MSFSEEQLSIYLKRLNEHFEMVNSQHNIEKQDIENKIAEVSKKISRLQELFLVDDTIENAEYNNQKQGLLLQKRDFEEKIIKLPDDNKTVYITSERLLGIASRVNSLYQSSRIDKKRKILSLVFSNFFLNGSKLSYDIKKAL